MATANSHGFRAAGLRQMLATWKKNPDPELAERLRQFECVCVVKMNLIKSTTCGGQARNGDLSKIGAEMFGLKSSEILYCRGKAKNFLDEVRELTRIRAKRSLPIDSDAMMAQIKERQVR